MYLIDIHGIAVGLMLTLILLPFLIVPLITADINIHRGSIRTSLVMICIGIRLHYATSVIGFDTVLVHCVGFRQVGYEGLPATAVRNSVHPVSGAIPVIELTYDRHRFGIRRPCSEHNAFRTVYVELVGSHKTVCMIVLTAVKQFKLSAAIIFGTNLHI